VANYHQRDLADLKEMTEKLKAVCNHPFDKNEVAWDDWRKPIDFSGLPWVPENLYSWGRYIRGHK
jgi:hypothetical protein